MSAGERLLIHVLGQDVAPAELPREGMLVLGSSPAKAGMLLDGQGVADVHCAIGRTKDGGWAVKDMGSEYGTMVNGKRVAQTRLGAGDQLLLGSLRLEIRPADQADSSTADSAPAAKPAAPASAKPKQAAPAQPSPAKTKRPTRTPEIKGYRVVDRLGRGAMGEVFLAVQESLDREVALKVLSKKLEADTMFVQSFQAEARAAAALNHPNVVTVHDVGEQDGVHYLTMEYMDRGSLEDRVNKQGPLHWRAALDALHDAASGLVYAESRGIVHRDIKPDNLMQNHTGTTKIADLGLASRESEDGDSGDSKIFGTPHFISPEQVRGEKADCRSDLYSLGATAFRLLTGHTPFEGESTREILRAKLTEDPASMQRYVTDIPEGMVRVVDRLLRREPVERYPSASSLLKELDALRTGREASEVGAPPKDSSKHFKLALPIGVAVLALISLPFLFGGDPEPEDPTTAGSPGDTPTETDGVGDSLAQDEPIDEPEIPVVVDDDTQEKLFEIEAENELLKLGQRDLDKATRSQRLRELAKNFMGTTAAGKALEEAERLDGEIAAASQAKAAHDTQLGAMMGALNAAAALDKHPISAVQSLRAMAAVPGQDAMLGDDAFLTARDALEAQVIAAALTELQADREQVEGLLQAGNFSEARPRLGELLTRTELPDFEEGRAPARSEEMLDLRSELRARIDGLEAAEAEFYSAQSIGDVRTLARVLADSEGLRGDLHAFDFDAAVARTNALTEQLSTAPRRAWSESLAADLEAAGSAFNILSEGWGHWRRKSVPDPRDPRGAKRPTLGVTEDGLRLDVKGSPEEVSWRDYAGHSGLLSTLFKDRLDRDYTAEESRSIAALLRFCAISEALQNSAEMLDPEAGAVFTAREADDLAAVFETALEWEQDATRRASLQHEHEAAKALASTLRAGSDSDWTRAVSALEHLLENYADSLLVLLLSDGSLATVTR